MQQNSERIEEETYQDLKVGKNKNKKKCTLS